MDAARWLLILVLTILYPQDYNAWTGKVVDVIRADEIQVQRNGTRETVRLYGIDSPIWWKTQGHSGRKNPAELLAEKKKRQEAAENKPPVPQNPGESAKAYTEERVSGKSVKVQPLPGNIQGPWYRPRIRLHDGYGRIIGLVSIDDVSLNRELLRKGWAWWYKPFVPFERGLKRLEDEARKARKGLWAQSDPIPPWEWQGTPLRPHEHPLQQNRTGAAR